MMATDVPAGNFVVASREKICGKNEQAEQKKAFHFPIAATLNRRARARRLFKTTRRIFRAN